MEAMNMVNGVNGSSVANSESSKAKPSYKKDDNAQLAQIRETFKALGTGSVSVRFARTGGEDNLEQATATLTFSKKNGAVESKAEVETISAAILAGRDNNAEPFVPEGGSWTLANPKSLEDAIQCLPDFAEVSFEVGLDAGTTSALDEHGLHMDHLYVVGRWTAYRNKKTIERRFLISTQVGPHDDARFGVR